MMNIVIPMAGAGSRFAKEGYLDPKPLIPVHGKPMIRVVIDNLRPKCPHRFIFICQRTHITAYGLVEKLAIWAPGCSVIELEQLTAGAACTVLAAKSLINNHDELMIANSDQYIDCNIDNYLDEMKRTNFDGLIMTMFASDPKWSFIELDKAGNVIRVVEKEVISNEATVGIYNFKHGCDFIASVESMIEANMRINGEFYVAPTYNELINRGKRIGIHNIGSDGIGMYGLGIPSDLNAFLALPISNQACKVTE
jgi:dTDP-glucose pyrophosphorylase